MGNRSKQKTRAKTAVDGDKPEKQGLSQDSLNDADFSVLMVNFQSAKLSSPTTVLVSNQLKANTCCEPLCEDDIVTPLHNFHLRAPAHSKSISGKRRKKTHGALNLSVAAGSIQRPMVWPARLKTTSSTVSRSILHPARLSALPSLTKSSKDVKNPSTIDKAVNKKVIELLRKNTTLDLSNQLAGSSHDVSTRLFGENASSIESLDDTHSFQVLSKNSSGKKTSKSSVAKFEMSSPLFSSYVRNTSMNASTRNTQVPSPPSSLPAEDPSPVRSCSSEMRLVEETNVNELASYLDDLLHIPRKMSTMAEMMYA